jgi:hypothetical protein
LLPGAAGEIGNSAKHEAGRENDNGFGEHGEGRLGGCCGILRRHPRPVNQIRF